MQNCPINKGKENGHDIFRSIFTDFKIFEDGY